MKKSPFDTISIVVCILSLFVFVYKYDAIPAGIHYDQMRLIVDNQYITYGWITHLPWRQLVYYWLHGGPLLSYMADLARLSGNYALLSTLPKFITMGYFYLGVFVLDSILREVRFTKYQRIIFYGIFVPSAFTVLLSKYIPHVASYFFFTLVAVWVSLKISNSNKWEWGKILLWLVILILGSCTHILAIVAILSSTILIVLFSRHIGFKTKVAHTSVFLALGVGVYLATMLAGDSTLIGREVLTSVQLLINGEYTKSLNVVLMTLATYISPAFWVTGGYISRSGVATAPDAWNMIKNPDMNQWIVNGLSAFGLISALIYLSPIIFWRKSKSEEELDQKVFGLVLVICYFAVSAIGIYDNPSLAKLAPMMVAVPYLITLILNTFSWNSKPMRYIVLLVVAVNAGWNLLFMWGNNYQVSETKKFDHTYEVISRYISQRFDYANDRIYLADRRWGYYTALEYYLGPSILNRVTPITSPEELAKLMQKDGRNWVITTESEYEDMPELNGSNRIYSTDGFLPLTLFAPNNSQSYGDNIVCQQLVNSDKNVDRFETKTISRLLSRPQVMNNVRYFSAVNQNQYVVNEPVYHDAHEESGNLLRSYGDRKVTYNVDTKQGSLEIVAPKVAQESVLTLSFAVKINGPMSTMIDIVDRNTGESFVGSQYINFNGTQSISWLQTPEQSVAINIYSVFTDPLIPFNSVKHGVIFNSLEITDRDYVANKTVYSSQGVIYKSYTSGLTQIIRNLPKGTYVCNVSFTPKLKVTTQSHSTINVKNVNGGSTLITLPDEADSVVFSVTP